MKTKEQKMLRDEILDAAKRGYQERSRALVRSGARTQQSMLLFSKDIVKEMKFHRRTDEF